MVACHTGQLDQCMVALLNSCHGCSRCGSLCSCSCLGLRKSLSSCMSTVGGDLEWSGDQDHGFECRMGLRGVATVRPRRVQSRQSDVRLRDIAVAAEVSK